MKLLGQMLWGSIDRWSLVETPTWSGGETEDSRPVGLQKEVALHGNAGCAPQIEMRMPSHG